MAKTSPRPTRRGFRRGLTDLIFSLRTEAQTPLLQALSVGTGVFIGCFPIYGLHLGVCVFVNRLFKLNLIKMYLATNINNPFSGPFLVYLEIQLGSLLRQGYIYEHTLETARTLLLRDFLFDVVLGSLAVGMLLGSSLGVLTFFAVRRLNTNPAMSKYVDLTSQRFLKIGILHWEISRACLRFDPLYREIIAQGVLPKQGSLIHIGCRRGLLLAFLDAATSAEVGKPGTTLGESLILGGVDDNSARVEVARRVLGDRVRVECQNLEAFKPDRCDVVVNLDQFKSVDQKNRETALRRAAEAVEPGGTLIVRASTAQPWTGLWPFTGLTESRVIEVVEDLRRGFTTRVLYRSLRRVVILAKREEPAPA